MKTGIIAALAAAQLTAAASPAQAAERPPAEPVTLRLGEDVELSLVDVRAQEPRAVIASDPQPASAAQPDQPGKKRRGTGDKVLTGAAIVLGVGALAVGGLLVAIFVN